MIQFSRDPEWDQNQPNPNTDEVRENPIPDTFGTEPTEEPQAETPSEEQAQATEQQPVQNTGYAFRGDEIPQPRYDAYPRPSAYPPYTQQTAQAPNPPYSTMPNQAGQNGYPPQFCRTVPPVYGQVPPQFGEGKPCKPKKKSKAGMALFLIACILLSGGAGYIGTYYAQKTLGNGNTVSGTNGGTSVVYKEAEKTADELKQKQGNSEVSVAEIASPTVVEISTETVVTSSFYGQYVTSGAGSGVIISTDGYILTCAHVVDDASAVTVKLSNGESYDAVIKGSDSQTDIAVLKIDVSELPAATVGDSSKLAVGELAVAIGNPLGSLGGSVTSGIISALDRSITIDGQSYTLLQTSAAINPGNSGGGLFDSDGALIGIVNAKSSGDSIEGLGFAIPINNAMEIAEQLMEFGYVKGRPIMGVSVVEVTSSNYMSLRASQYAAILNYATEYGVYFAEYTNGTSGDFQFGDRIVAIDGTTVSSFSDIKNILNEYAVGDTIKVTVSRIEDIKSRQVRSNMVDVSVTLIENVPTEETEAE